MEDFGLNLSGTPSTPETPGGQNWNCNLSEIYFIFMAITKWFYYQSLRDHNQFRNEVVTRERLLDTIIPEFFRNISLTSLFKFSDKK